MRCAMCVADVELPGKLEYGPDALRLRREEQSPANRGLPLSFLLYRDVLIQDFVTTARQARFHDMQFFRFAF
jgi:hypothetical protein